MSVLLRGLILGLAIAAALVPALDWGAKRVARDVLDREIARRGPFREDPIDPADPLYCVALSRTARTLYGLQGDFLVARKARGRFFLESLPYRSDAVFRPGEFVPDEVAAPGEYRIRELSSREWAGLRDLAAHGGPDPFAETNGFRDVELHLCGVRRILLGAGPGLPRDPRVERFAQALAALAGNWKRPPDPLPHDAFDKILEISVSEAAHRAGDYAAWELKAERDESGPWIRRTIDRLEVEGADESGEPVRTVRRTEFRRRMSQGEWVNLLAYIRARRLLEWRPRETGEVHQSAGVVIRSVVDVRWSWSGSVGSQPEIAVLKSMLSECVRRHENADEND